MHRVTVFAAGFLSLGLVAFVSSAERTGDWPQWRGPQRTGLSAETGLLKTWPAAGPSVLWKVDTAGVGFSTLAVSAGRIFTQGNLADAAGEDRETILALDEKSGATVWKHVPAPEAPAFTHKRGSGPRGTPTIDGGRLYAVGGRGDVSCLEVETGKPVWHKSLTKDFGGSVPGWGYSESPLIDGARVIVTPGGSDGCIVALSKETGEIIWRSTDVKEGAHYSSAIAADVVGVHQIIQFTRERVVGLNAEYGTLLWSYNNSANRTANISTPIYADSCVFSASGYGTGGGLVKLTRAEDTFQANEVYFEKSMQNHHGGIVLVDGYLYGFGSNALICLNFKTGEVAWQNRSVGKGSLTYADGHLYCLGENQTVGLVEAKPKEYVEKGRFKIPDSGEHSWAHPVVANGCLYLRDQGTLTCYDVRKK